MTPALLTECRAWCQNRLDLGDELGDHSLVGDVGNIAVRIKAQLAVVLLGLGDFVGVTGVKGNLGAGLAERLGHGHADTVGAPVTSATLPSRRKLSIRLDIAILPKETFIYISLASNTSSV